ITPYRRHKNHIKRLLYKNNLNVETDTIYRFQGRQKDVIILCFCKSREGMLSKFQENFISNQNQLNVSITRSCKKLIIIGDISLLSQSKNIKNLINEISPLNTIFLSDCI
ncbi:C-terminal helicase domain-containing protein, partial [Methanosphaera sp.]